MQPTRVKSQAVVAISPSCRIFAAIARSTRASGYQTKARPKDHGRKATKPISSCILSRQPHTHTRAHDDIRIPVNVLYSLSRSYYCTLHSSDPGYHCTITIEAASCSLTVVTPHLWCFPALLVIIRFSAGVVVVAQHRGCVGYPRHSNCV